MLKRGIRTKSSYSASTGAQCTEVTDTGTGIEFTDSKCDPSPVLTIPRSAFASLVASVKAGAYGG